MVFSVSYKEVIIVNSKVVQEILNESGIDISKSNNVIVCDITERN